MAVLKQLFLTAVSINYEASSEGLAVKVRTELDETELRMPFNCENVVAPEIMELIYDAALFRHQKIDTDDTFAELDALSQEALTAFDLCTD